MHNKYFVYFQTLTYNKEESETGLRLILNFNVRGHYVYADKCTQWFLTFNGQKCDNPGNIQQVDYSLGTNDFHTSIDCESQIKINVFLGGLHAIDFFFYYFQH